MILQHQRNQRLLSQQVGTKATNSNPPWIGLAMSLIHNNSRIQVLACRDRLQVIQMVLATPGYNKHNQLAIFIRTFRIFKEQASRPPPLRTISKQTALVHSDNNSNSNSNSRNRSNINNSQTIFSLAVTILLPQRSN